MDAGAEAERSPQLFKAYWKSAAKSDTVTMTFQADPPIRVDLDVEEVADIIRNLGEMRALMQPEHSMDLPDAADSKVVFNPRWVCEHEPVLAHSILRIRDRRYGWLHYAIPRDVGDELASTLTSHRTAPSKRH
jgi:hypothetical protein